MDFQISDSLDNRKHADVLVLPYWKGKKHAENAFKSDKFATITREPILAGDFLGKEGEVVILYSKGQPEPRIALLGLGEIENASVERLRRAYASVVKICRNKKAQNLNVLVPSIKSLSEEEIARGISEGLLFLNYSFNKLKNDVLKEEANPLIKKVTLINASKSFLAVVKKYATILDSVYYVRDLVNDNADTITPDYLAKEAVKLSKTLPHIKTTVFDRKRIQKEKMGFIYAVGRAAVNDPRFVLIEYKGNPKSKDLTVIIGKGITYDTGGLHLKPLNGMDTMRCDMGGAAAVLGVVQAASKLGLKQNITAILSAAENAIDAASYKPGDVYVGYSGKTVEITSTDAEGRLVLADALAYAAKNLKPTRMIDIATLTGGIDIALGAEATGLMSNNDELADALVEAGNVSHERVWRMPLFDEYREQLKSDVADMKNTGGRSASPITAAMFLKQYVDDIPWAHLDIASTAFYSEHRRYHPKHATGVGVRLLIQFLENANR